MITRDMTWGARPYCAVVIFSTIFPSPSMLLGTPFRSHSATSTITRRGVICLKVVKLGARSPAISTTVACPRWVRRTVFIRFRPSVLEEAGANNEDKNKIKAT
jgi:hypothetical protein